MSGAQMGRYRLRRVGDIAEVGFVICIQRSGDADDNGVRLCEPGIVGGGFESLGACFLNLSGRDAKNVGSALSQR